MPTPSHEPSSASFSADSVEPFDPQEQPSGVHAIERRRDRRAAFEVDVTIESNGQRYPGIARDLSQGGVFVFTYRTLPCGTRVEVGFPVLQHYVRTSASVRWSQASAPGVIPGLALAFDDLNDDALTTILRVCGPR